MTRIEAVITDFGGVLTTPLFNAFGHLQEAHGIPLEALGKAMWAVAQQRGGENPLFPLERGEMTEAEFMRLVGDAVSAEVGRPVSMHDFAEGYFAQLEPNHRMIEYLRSLRSKRGIRLAMLTNNVREWEARWRAMIPQIDATFEVIVDSAFVGMRKPEPGIYELTLSRLGLPAHACAFVDDLEHNCTAAAELGIRAVRFADTEQAIAELETLLSD